MASYHTVPVDEQQLPATPTFQPRKSRSALATVMLTICIVTFVLQTELAQYVQKTTNYSKPYFILSIYRNIIDTINNSKSSVNNSIVELQYRVQGNHVFPLGFILKTSLCLSILLTLPSYIWYLSVNLTTMSNLTAIYNTGCFFAYLFSIIMLHDRIVGAKVGAVLLCMLGVLAMACWPQGTDDSGDN
ncbi:uncharacterized protein EV154DRAFT_476714, partial [Mucor mucedo]|uniref:uncharacterized protein n=1 Tax=Mucor mucedo TaxID=29922 RepID=UPI002220FF1F